MHISTLKKITLSILLVVALSPTHVFANAAKGVGSCIGSAGIVGYVQSAIGSLATGVTTVPVADGPLEAKESGILGSGISWDQMGWCLANAAIEQIGNATVQWINSGFQGNPVFVTDPAGFFANLADVQAGAFFAELGGGGMCPSLQNIVRINLANSYNSRYSQYGNTNQCTFSGIAGSLEQFTSGQSFSWQDWLSYTQVPQNNELGATMFGQIELDNRIAAVLGLEKNKLDWSGGFFSIEDPETGEIKTPGRVVEEQINEKLFSGQRRIEVADEFNEVVSALVSQLISTSIGEIMGTGSSSYGGYSGGYEDNSLNETGIIVFDENGGFGTMPSQYFGINTPEALQSNSFIRSNYNFLGWNTAADGTGASFANGAIIAVDPGTTTLYAQWTTEEVYTLSVSKIGEGTVQSRQSIIRCGSNCTGTFEDGTEVTLTATPAQGYTFVRWQGGLCGDITEPTCRVTMDQSRNVTATFTENTYTLNFDANGATGSMLIQIFNEGETKAINQNTYTRLGYTFLGWSTTANGAVAYEDRDRYTMGTRNTTLYAVWEEN